MASKKRPRPEDQPEHPLSVTNPDTPVDDPGYVPGPNYGGFHAGGISAGDLGGGVGGDIDRPDSTGRGTTDDLLRDDRQRPPSHGGKKS
jgi:hypothetical protein